MATVSLEELAADFGFDLHELRNEAAAACATWTEVRCPGTFWTTRNEGLRPKELFRAAGCATL